MLLEAFFIHNHIFFCTKLSVSDLFRFKTYTFIHEENFLNYFLICLSRMLRVLADMSAKKFFMDGSPNAKLNL